jgi:hypothetical protein
MRALCLAVAAAALVGFSGCGSATDPAMPDVTGKKLDIAKGAIEGVGVKDEVKVDGGGVFGVVDESNWEVCEQSPAAGEAVFGAPRLTVDRSCHDDAKPAKTSEPNTTVSDPSEPAPTASSNPDADRVLTKDNSKELAALLKVSDYCDPSVGPFAAANTGRTIEFDGSIVKVANHGDYDTRYDFLLAPGDKGANSTIGPAFQFDDVNVFDLNLSGRNKPDSVGEGDRFEFVAQIGEYNPNGCLLVLAPVETRVR